MEKHCEVVLTADMVVLSKDGSVLLIKRKNEPFTGMWALPGGKLDPEDETIEACARRELSEETGLLTSDFELLGVYSRKDRDPRGRYISVAYLAHVARRFEPAVGDDAQEAQWFPIDELPQEMAFDHHRIVMDALCHPRDRSEHRQMPDARDRDEACNG